MTFDDWSLFTGASEAHYNAYADVVEQYPSLLDDAVDSWAKYKVGLKYGLFTSGERSQIESQFDGWPKLWSAVRPNYEAGGAYNSPDVVRRSESFVGVLTNDLHVTGIDVTPPLSGGLGVAPIIVAGVLVAGIIGLAGVLWSIGYIKKQGNVSRLIEETVSGNLSESVLTAAVAEEKNSWFDTIGNMVTLGILAVGVYLFWPQIKKVFSDVG